MSLYKTAVEKPVSTILVFIGLVVMGLFSYTKLAVDLMPEIETTQISIITAYPGASASDVETNVTRLIEDVLNQVENLKKIESQSKENMSLVTIELEYGTDIDVATNDVRDKLDMIVSQLPDEIESPTIFKFSTDMIPVVIYSATATESVNSLHKILDEKVANPLNRVSGVGTVSITGAPKRQVQVNVNPAKIEAYNLGIEQIANVIRQENLNTPAGSFDIGTQTYALRIEGEFKESSELNDIVVGSFNGKTIFLKDVATVFDDIEERVQEAYTNGIKGATIVVQKQAGANTVSIANKVTEMMPELQKTLPSDVKLVEVMDTSEFIDSSINSLIDTVLYAFVFVVLVVFLFLGRWRATFIIILTIPISLISAFAYLAITGGTLNIISLSSLSIAIGMVVDDAIVVLENITTHIEKGSAPKSAAIYATNEVAISVVASTLTIVAVFLPLTMVTGLAGVLFKQLGWMVTIVCTVSTIVALTLTPMLCSQMLRMHTSKNKWFDLLYGPVARALDALDNGYAKLLNLSVRHRFISSFACLGIFILSLIITKDLKTEFMPASDNDRIGLTIEMPAGTRMELARDKAAEITRLFQEKYPEIDVTSYSVGQADSENAFASMQDNGTGLVTFTITCFPLAERTRTIFEISDLMREDLALMPELYKVKVQPGGGGGGPSNNSGSFVDVEIFGHDLATTDRVAADLKKRFEEHVKGMTDIQIDRKDYQAEYQVELDREKLALHELNSATVSSFVRNRINGAFASKFREDGDEYDIVVRYDLAHRQSVEDIENIIVYTNKGKGIRLKELGNVVEKFSLPQIDRQDRERIVRVSGLVSGAALSEVVASVNEQIALAEIPSEIGTKIGGSFVDQQESFGELAILMILLVLLVYIVMATQFESFSYPFIIMFSIPFGFGGVWLALWLVGKPLDLMAMIGMVTLIGIVVKNGIVLIDYITLNRERGMSIMNAVVDGGKSRLRPVLMTTLTTVLGMIPMAVGTGQGSEMWQTMGIAIIGGLTFSTIITLILVPSLYSIFGRNGVVRQRKKFAKMFANVGK
jgi:HAE1 family hydrophobic/amphiphilic exporter-1